MQIPDQQITLQAGDVYESSVTYILATTGVFSTCTCRPIHVVTISVWNASRSIHDAGKCERSICSQEVTFSAPSYTHLYATIVISPGDLASLSLDNNMPIPATWTQTIRKSFKENLMQDFMSSNHRT